MEEDTPAAEVNQAKEKHCRGVEKERPVVGKSSQGMNGSACGIQGMDLSVSLAKVQKLALQLPVYVTSVCYLTFLIFSFHL